MIKIKISGKNKKKAFTFKNKFAEFNTSEFGEFIQLEHRLFKLEDEIEAKEKEFEKIDAKAPGGDTLVIIADAELQDLDRQLRATKIEMLAILSNNGKKLTNFLLDTVGINGKYVNALLYKVYNSMGKFKDWVKAVKPVKTFRFTDYKKPNFWNFTKVRDFEVFDMSNQTVLRDSAAMIVSKKLDDMNGEFAKNRWENLPRFLAYVSRPATQKEEINVRDKKAFLGGKEVAALSIEDRLKAYNDKLAEVVEMRTPIFGRLPLPIAIGVYKQYFFLSRH